MPTKKPLRRPWTVKDELDLWRHWKEGRSIADIARALRRSMPTVLRNVEHHGGIPPRPRSRAERQLSLEERETISRGISADLSIRGIAAQLGRPPSTISREIKRNGGRDAYRATVADERAWDKARRHKFFKLALNARLADTVVRKLRLQWSPQQIAGWLKQRYPDNPRMHVSHETIYRTLFVQTRGELNRELTDHLRRGRHMRRAKRATDTGARGPIVDGISISERPAAIEDRAVPGHWEGDLLVGDRDSAIATLVERRTRFVMLVKIPSRDSKTVVKAVAKHIRKLPAELRRSLTWDRGAEMARHKDFSIATDVKVYFCDPHSPWQRGSNENTNGLLRQYFPKGEPLDDYSQAQLNMVARRLNGRPRMTLGYKTPAESFSACVASSA